MKPIVYFTTMATLSALGLYMHAPEANAQTRGRDSRFQEVRDLYITRGECQTSSRAGGNPYARILIHLNEHRAPYNQVNDWRGILETSTGRGPLLCAQLVSAFIRGERLRMRLSYDRWHLAQDIRPAAVIEEVYSILELETGMGPQLYSRFDDILVRSLDPEGLWRREQLAQSSIPFRPRPGFHEHETLETWTPISFTVGGSMIEPLNGGTGLIELHDAMRRRRLRIDCRGRITCPNPSVTLFDEAGQAVGKMIETDGEMVERLFEARQVQPGACPTRVTVHRHPVLRVVSVQRNCDQ